MLGSKGLLIVLCMLLASLAVTGQQCDPNTLLFGDTEEYRAIRDVVSRFKDGINAVDQSILNEVISKTYSAGGLDRLGVIKDYFDEELKIDKINISNISVDGSGAGAEVGWTGKVTLRPKPDIPYVAEMIPELSGDVNAGMIFGFKKEDDGKWRITAAKVLSMTKTAVLGSSAPFISKFTVKPAMAAPGKSILINADLVKVGGNVMLAAVNDKPLINSLTGLKDGSIDPVKVTVPSSKTPGSAFDVYIIALGVNADFLNPSRSSITGITLKQISVPVE